jgi:hypothetical protein
MTAAELKGRRARVVDVIRNGYAELPVGAVVTVTGKLSGLAIASEKCQSCGVRVFVSKVDPGKLELLPIATATARP